MRTAWSFGVVVGAFTLALGCGDSGTGHAPAASDNACTPGIQMPCACDGGEVGTTQCLASGAGFDACTGCHAVPEGGSDAADASDAPADVSEEGAADGGANDAAPDEATESGNDAPADDATDSGDEAAIDATPDAFMADGSGGADGVADAGYDAEFVDGSTCGAVIQQQPFEGAQHVAVCSATTYLSNPPSSGDHYPIWAAFRSYTVAVPEGFWVHALEHGAVVLSYNCPSGCDAEVAAAQAFIDALPVDPACAGMGVSRRVIMTPDPALTTKWAASAWTWTLRADCFDPVAFGLFAADHYAQAPENFCSDGADLSNDAGLWCTAPDAGAD